MMLRFMLLTVLSAFAWTIATVCCVIPRNAILISYNAYGILWHVLPVNLLVHPALLASGSHYIDYLLDNVLFTKPL